MTNFKTKDGKEVSFTSKGEGKAKTKKVKELEKRVKQMEKTVNKMGAINWHLIKREQDRAKFHKEQVKMANSKKGYDHFHKKMEEEDKEKKKNLTGISPKPPAKVRKPRINHYEDAKLTVKIREMMEKMKNEKP